MREKDGKWVYHMSGKNQSRTSKMVDTGSPQEWRMTRISIHDSLNEMKNVQSLRTTTKLENNSLTSIFNLKG